MRGDDAMKDHSSAELLARLDILMAERIAPSVFLPLDPVPDFCSAIFKRNKSGENPPLSFKESFFLTEFLQEAETFWAGSTSGQIQSGPWVESDGNNTEYCLSATAVSLEEKKYLALFLLGGEFQDRQNRLQSCRNMFLEERGRRRVAEQAQSESEEKYRTLFEQSTDALFVAGLDGHIVEANAACRALAASSEDVGLLDKLENLARYTEDKASFERQMNEYGRVINLECAVPQAAGTVRLHLLSSSPWRGPDGSPQGYLCTARDITDRKQAEEERRLLATAIDQAAECIVITDANGTILFANPAFETISGYPADKAVGADLGFLFRMDSDKETQRKLWEELESKDCWNGRYENEREDGTRYSEESTISAVRNDDGDIVNYVALLRDVSKEVHLQRQLMTAQKMEAVGTLSAGIAHDFNNVLHVIQGYAEMVQFDIQKGQSGHEKLEEIKKICASAAELSHGLLTFSRSTETQHKPVNLNSEILQVARMITRTIPKMISIRLDLTDEIVTIDADPSQLQQVLMNLAINARDAMPDGGEIIIDTKNTVLDREFCQMHPDTSPGPYALLTLTDTGCGMDKNTIERIFEPFFSTKEPGKGTGLGLAVAYGIVKSHSGIITCRSEPGRGTAFSIYFPALQTRPLEKQTEPRENLVGGTETILIVDDESVVRKIGASILTFLGYRVLEAADGKEALEILQENMDTVSLVILDLVMPNMDGRVCLHNILKIKPSVKVIIASGYCSDETIAASLADGAKASIKKPYGAKEILKIVRSMLDKADP
jgi:PAS domain S-box-containing protein